MTSTPQGMTMSGNTQTSITLAWNASSDNVGVTGYRLFRNGSVAGTTTQTSYTYSGLSCGTTYTLALEAYDAAGNRSNRAEATTTRSTQACGLPLPPLPPLPEIPALPPLGPTGGETPATGPAPGSWPPTRSTRRRADRARRLRQRQHGRRGRRDPRRAAATARRSSFDGTNDMVSVADSASLDLERGMTLEAWVRPTAIGSTWRTVLVKEQPKHLSYALYAGNGNGKTSGHVFTSRDRALAGTALTKNRWTHLATTWDGSTLRVWVDGKQVASEALGGTAKVSNGSLRIGGNTVWAEWFKGQIDEVRVYNRALDAGEIATDMATPIGLAAAPRRRQVDQAPGQAGTAPSARPRAAHTSRAGCEIRARRAPVRRAGARRAGTARRVPGGRSAKVPHRVPVRRVPEQCRVDRE